MQRFVQEIGFQKTRDLPDRLFDRVAGDLAKCGINVFNNSIVVRNHHRYRALLDRAMEFEQLFIGELQLGCCLKGLVLCELQEHFGAFAFTDITNGADDF